MARASTASANRSIFRSSRRTRAPSIAARRLSWHLHARGFFQLVTHPEAGTHPYPGIMWKMSKTPATIRRPAVRMGEDNGYVYRE
ncbi:MAG: hypothetical protein ACREOH_06140, partial [Candidatus Entotheonellia bacterium]